MQELTDSRRMRNHLSITGTTVLRIIPAYEAFSYVYADWDVDKSILIFFLFAENQEYETEALRRRKWIRDRLSSNTYLLIRLSLFMY